MPPVAVKMTSKEELEQEKGGKDGFGEVGLGICSCSASPFKCCTDKTRGVIQ